MLWLPAFLPFAKLREWQVWGNLNPYLNDVSGLGGDFDLVTNITNLNGRY